MAVILAPSTLTIVLIVITVVLLAAIVALYFLGKKAQAKQADQQAQIDAMKQTVSMLIIDKKRVKIKESGLPQAVICLLYTSPSPRDMRSSRMPSSA